MIIAEAAAGGVGGKSVCHPTAMLRAFCVLLIFHREVEKATYLGSSHVQCRIGQAEDNENWLNEPAMHLLMHTKVQLCLSTLYTMCSLIYADNSILSNTARVNWWVLLCPPISRVRTDLK